jgi:hypothetical protein
MSIEDEFAELYKSLEEFSEDCKTVRKQVRNVYRRARDEETDLFRAPLKARREELVTWWAQEGCGKPLTIENVTVVMFKKCEKDIAARMMTLAAPEAAVLGWKREKTISVFDFMEQLPKLFF